MFILDIAYLALLFALAWAYNTGRLIEPLKAIPDPVGSMPLAVPWFGALGGVLISLTGVHQHRYDWDNRYWSWYAVRPLVGGAVAVIAVMIMQAGILATGVDPKDTEFTTRNTFYYLVAWIVGYREATFRSLVKRLADVILTSAEEGLPPRVLEVSPPTGPAGGGTNVTIKGAGFMGAEAVTFGSTESPTIRVVSDTVIEATAPAGAVGAVAVGVVTPKGSAAMADAFVYA